MQFNQVQLDRNFEEKSITNEIVKTVLRLVQWGKHIMCIKLVPCRRKFVPYFWTIYFIMLCTKVIENTSASKTNKIIMIAIKCKYSHNINKKKVAA